MKWGLRVMGIARGRRRGREFVNFAITAVLAFNRRGFVVRRGIEVGAAGDGDSEREKKGKRICLLRHYCRIGV